MDNVSVVFLDSAAAIAAKIRDVIQRHRGPQPIRLAVAFWGDGAADFLIPDQARCQVLCNLAAGGTNPDVISQLQNRSGIEVRHRPDLHAKVVHGYAGAVVSSANFSAAGLGFSSIVRAWEEAGTFLDGGLRQHAEVGHWFDRLWATAEVVTDADLEAARRLWSKRQTPQPGTPEEKLSPEAKSYRTVHFHTNELGPVFLRSATAIVALGGQAGGWMPLALFRHLFNGGADGKAYDYHQKRFEEDSESVRLLPGAIGYFVGTDATLASATGRGRAALLKDYDLAESVRWMLHQVDCETLDDPSQARCLGEFPGEVSVVQAMER